MVIKEMFYKLGYKRYHIRPNDKNFDKEMIKYRKIWREGKNDFKYRQVIINIHSKKSGVWLVRPYKGGHFKTHDCSEVKTHPTTFEEHKAIHQQMIELGWLNE